jgi:NAD(P) transhydrogenase subunit alpha
MSPYSVTLLAATAAPEGGGLDVKTFLTLLFVLMLATFIGLEVIRNVSRLLHTPLMSLTNAISAIAVVGSILLAGKAAGGEGQPVFVTILGMIALAASMTNIVSGFLLTDRMLKMFKKREPGKS